MVVPYWLHSNFEKHIINQAMLSLCWYVTMAECFHEARVMWNYFWKSQTGYKCWRELFVQVSYMILQRVSPVTHSVGNCVKRVVVIVTSVLFFRTPVSPINSIGTGIALAGVFLYSRVKRIKPKPKTAWGFCGTTKFCWWFCLLD